MPPVRVFTPLQAMKLDREELKKFPRKFRRLTLTAAGNLDEEYRGNCIIVLKLAGTNPEIRIRLNDEGDETMRITSEVVLPFPFDRVFVDWDAIVGGEVDLLFCTVIP
jgi:hypothetical protein